jgi:hypothetical protein
MIVKVLFLLFFYCYLVNINIVFSKETNQTDNYKDIVKRRILSSVKPTDDYKDMVKRRILSSVK